VTTHPFGRLLAGPSSSDRNPSRLRACVSGPATLLSTTMARRVPASPIRRLRRRTRDMGRGGGRLEGLDDDELPPTSRGLFAREHALQAATVPGSCDIARYLVLRLARARLRNRPPGLSGNLCRCSRNFVLFRRGTRGDRQGAKRGMAPIPPVAAARRSSRGPATPQTCPAANFARPSTKAGHLKIQRRRTPSRTLRPKLFSDHFMGLIRPISLRDAGRCRQVAPAAPPSPDR